MREAVSGYPAEEQVQHHGPRGVESLCWDHKRHHEDLRGTKRGERCGAGQLAHRLDASCSWSSRVSLLYEQDADIKRRDWRRGYAGDREGAGGAK